MQSAMSADRGDPSRRYLPEMSSPKAPPVSLRPLTAEDYEAWRARSSEGYAADIGPARGLDPATALATAYRETDSLLPDGPNTANHLLWLAWHDGALVGSLWIGLQKADPFIYLIEVA